jgi:stalled ribosome alternative rescue factor ArfA
VKKGRMKEGKGLGLERDMRGRQSIPQKKGKGEYQKKRKRNKKEIVDSSCTPTKCGVANFPCQK